MPSLAQRTIGSTSDSSKHEAENCPDESEKSAITKSAPRLVLRRCTPSTIAAITAALLTLLLVLSCAIGCGAILALTINIF